MTMVERIRSWQAENLTGALFALESRYYHPAQPALAALAGNTLAQPGGTRPPSLTAAVDKTPGAPPTSTPLAAATASTVPIATSTIASMLTIAVRLDGGLPNLQGYLGGPARDAFQPRPAAITSRS